MFISSSDVKENWVTKDEKHYTSSITQDFLSINHWIRSIYIMVNILSSFWARRDKSEINLIRKELTKILHSFCIEENCKPTYVLFHFKENFPKPPQKSFSLFLLQIDRMLEKNHHMHGLIKHTTHSPPLTHFSHLKNTDNVYKIIIYVNSSLQETLVVFKRF